MFQAVGAICRIQQDAEFNGMTPQRPRRSERIVMMSEAPGDFGRLSDARWRSGAQAATPGPMAG